jgi:hypothetical protein
MSRATEIRVAALRTEMDAVKAEAVARDDVLSRLLQEVSLLRQDLDRLTPPVKTGKAA